MRILFLTQILPYPPDSGPKIKTYNVLRFLAQRHEVHLISFVRNRQEEEAALALRQLCSSVHTIPIRRSPVLDCLYLVRSLIRNRPFLVERDESRALREAINQLLLNHSFDAVHADQLTMGQFAVNLPVPIRVLDEHNAVWTIVQRAAHNASFGLLRLLAELEWRKLRYYEGTLCRQFDRVTVVSEEDRNALEQAAGRAIAMEVIPIAVDTTKLPFKERTADARDIISVATMFYPPNIEGVKWFAQWVFPRIRRSIPSVEFQIVGARPPRSIQQLADIYPGVAVKGYVADLDSILKRCAVFVVPVLSGSGMRVKILDAFARGIPVVSTKIGVEGIDAVPGKHLSVVDDPVEFAGEVIRLIEDQDEGKRLAQAARRLVEEKYDWRMALTGLDRVYRQ